MADLFSMKGGVMWAILNKLAGQLSPELGEAINKNDSKVIDRMIEAGEAHLRPKTLIRGRFRPVEQQVLCISELSQQYKLGFTSDELLLAMASVPQWPEGDLTALVLVPYQDVTAVDSVGRTFWSLFNALRKQSALRVFHDSANLDSLKAVDHPGRCLRWEAINLAANRGRGPMFIEHELGAPSAGILAAAILHPEWFASMNGDDVPFVWMPGYTVAGPNVLNIRRHGTSPAAIYGGHPNYPDHKMAVPEFVRTSRPVLAAQ